MDKILTNRRLATFSDGFFDKSFFMPKQQAAGDRSEQDERPVFEDELHGGMA